MQTRKLGWTDLNLTTIGLGTWAQGGGSWKYSWGPQNDRESIATIHRALELGINWIDTAPVYGLGHAEEVLGRALKEIPKNQRPIIATKCSRIWDKDGNISGNLKRESIRRELEDSLVRIGVETIDLYQIHWPLPEEDIEEGWDTVARLVKEGKVRFGGVSNFSLSQLKRIKDIHPVASIQPPYSMLKRDIEQELLSYCDFNRIGVVVYSPMQKGILTGMFSRVRIKNLPKDDHRREDPVFQEPQLSANLKLVEGLRSLARKYHRTPAQLAVAWVLSRREITSAIVGARKPVQIEETAAAGNWELAQDEIKTIEELLEERDRV